VPDYIKTIRKGGFYFWLTCLVPLSVSGKTTDCPMARLGGFMRRRLPDRCCVSWQLSKQNNALSRALFLYSRISQKTRIVFVV